MRLLSLATRRVILPSILPLVPCFRGGAVADLVDYSGDAISYFNSIRTPAALIVGSSLTALFTLISKTESAELARRNKLERFAIVFYHILSLATFLLGMNVILTSTAAGNLLLLDMTNSLASSPFELMRREMNYEFSMVQWSFLTSCLSFLGCVLFRALIEFRLLTVLRWRSGMFMTLSMFSLIFHLFSFINQRLISWNHMGSMTVDVFRLYVQRSLSGKRPYELASVACFLGAVLVGSWVLFIAEHRDFDEEAENGTGAVEES